MPEKFTVLIVDDEPAERASLAELATGCWNSSKDLAAGRSLELRFAPGVPAAIESFKRKPANVVIADVFDQRSRPQIVFEMHEYLKSRKVPPILMVSTAVPEDARQIDFGTVLRDLWVVPADKPLADKTGDVQRFYNLFKLAVHRADGWACRNQWVLTGNSSALQQFLANLVQYRKSKLVLLQAERGMQAEILEASDHLKQTGDSQVNLVRVWPEDDESEQRLWSGGEQLPPALIDPRYSVHTFLLDLDNGPIDESIARRLTEAMDGEWTIRNSKFRKNPPCKISGPIVVGLMGDVSALSPAWRYLVSRAASIYVPRLRERREDLPIIFEKKLEMLHEDSGEMPPRLSEVAQEGLKRQWDGQSSSFEKLCNAFQGFVGTIESGEILAKTSPNVQGANQKLGEPYPHVRLCFHLGQARYHTVTCEVENLPSERLTFPGGATALLLRLALMQEVQTDPLVYVGEKNVYDLRDTHRNALKDRYCQIPQNIMEGLLGAASPQRQDIVESSQDAPEVWANLLYFLRDRSASTGAGYNYRLNAMKVSLSVVIAAS